MRATASADNLLELFSDELLCSVTVICLVAIIVCRCPFYVPHIATEIN